MAIRSDGEKTRRDILDAACQIFAEKGYDEATHTEICGLAGVNSASVNYHFGSKEELYRATWQHLVDQAVRAYPHGGGVREDAAFEDRLRGFLGSILSKIVDPRLACLHRIRLMEIARPTGMLDRSLAKPLGMCRRDADALLMDLLGESIDKQTLEFCALSVLGPCLSLQQALYGRGICPTRIYSNEEVEEMLDHMVSFSMAGLREILHRGDSWHEMKNIRMSRS